MFFKILTFLFVLISSSFSWAGIPRFEPIEMQDAGIGEWQEMPFGQMRVLSCTTGVKNLPMVVGGVQVRLNPDWIMKKPDLKPLSEKEPVWIEAPIAPGDGRNPLYQGEVLFPLVYAHSPSDNDDFELGVQGNFPVCQDKKCMTLPIRIGLTLKPDEADYTAACPYLIEQQRQTPLPADMQGIQGKAWIQGDIIQMAFSGINAANFAFLQTTQKNPFQVLETQMEPTGILMRVKTSPWEFGKKQDWILITDKGVVKVPVQMAFIPSVLPPPAVSKTIWLLGWELFFLTPLFIWWGLGCTRSNKGWKKEILSMMILLPIALFLRGIIGFILPLDFMYYGIVLLGLVCLFPPVKKWVALGLLLIWPYFPSIPEMKVGLFMLWGLIMLIEVLIPFVFLYIKAEEIGKILREFKKKNFFGFNLIFLIPTVILFCGFGYQIYQGKVTFSNKLNPEGLTVLCSPKEVGVWKNEAHLVDPDSVLGNSLQKMYARKEIIIWQDKHGRLILAPKTSKKRAQEAILNWKNYHVVNTP